MQICNAEIIVYLSGQQSTQFCTVSCPQSTARPSRRHWVVLAGPGLPPGTGIDHKSTCLIIVNFDTPSHYLGL